MPSRKNTGLDVAQIVTKAVAKVRRDHGVVVTNAVSGNLVEFAKGRQADIAARSLSERTLVKHAAARLLRDISNPGGPCIPDNPFDTCP